MTALQAILPQHLLSRLVGKLAQLEHPVWLKNLLIRSFMRRYDIDLTEATCSSGEDFPALQCVLHAVTARGDAASCQQRVGSYC